MMEPVVDNVAVALADRFYVGRVDIDQHAALAMTSGVHSVPALLFFVHGTVVD